MVYFLKLGTQASSSICSLSVFLNKYLLSAYYMLDNAQHCYTKLILDFLMELIV